MSFWSWVVIGLGSFLVVSLLVGLAVALILGSIARKVSELYETEEWALSAPRRALQDAEPRAEGLKKHHRLVRLR
jgi:hypothetical protein